MFEKRVVENDVSDEKSKGEDNQVLPLGEMVTTWRMSLRKKNGEKLFSQKRMFKCNV